MSGAARHFSSLPPVRQDGQTRIVSPRARAYTAPSKCPLGGKHEDEWPRRSQPLQIWRSMARVSSVVAFGGVVLLAGAIAASGGETQPAASASATTTASESGAALVLRRDSGKEGETSASGLHSESFETSSSRSAGLVERSGVTEAGGMMVGLRGRFRTTLVLERKADGSTAARCISDLPGASPGDH